MKFDNSNFFLNIIFSRIFSNSEIVIVRRWAQERNGFCECEKKVRIEHFQKKLLSLLKMYDV